MKIKSLVLGIGMLSLLPVNKFVAQSDQKIPVEIVDYSVDVLGRSLVYHVKEGIRSSNAFRLSYGNEARLQLIIETGDPLDAIPEYSNSMTVYSVVWVLKGDDLSSPAPIYLRSMLNRTGGDAIKVAAENMVVETDRLGTDILRYLSP